VISTARGASTRELSYRQRWGNFAALQHGLLERLSSRAGLHLYGVYLRPLDAVNAPEPVVPGYVVRLFTQGDEHALLAAANEPELELTQSFVCTALGKGDVCAAVLVDGQVVSFGWSAFTPTRHRDGVYVSFDARHRYGYFAFTLSEHRGRHLPRLAVPLRDRYCVARGCTHSISFISVDNRSSIRMATAIGNRRVGFAGYLKLGPIFFPFRTRAVREQGFRFFSRDTSVA
jgi:hypothetical protein